MAALLELSVPHVAQLAKGMQVKVVARRHTSTCPSGKVRYGDKITAKLVPDQATFALSTTARRRRSSAWRFRQMM